MVDGLTETRRRARKERQGEQKQSAVVRLMVHVEHCSGLHSRTRE